MCRKSLIKNGSRSSSACNALNSFSKILWCEALACKHCNFSRVCLLVKMASKKNCDKVCLQRFYTLVVPVYLETVKSSDNLKNRMTLRTLKSRNLMRLFQICPFKARKYNPLKYCRSRPPDRWFLCGTTGMLPLYPLSRR